MDTGFVDSTQLSYSTMSMRDRLLAAIKDESCAWVNVTHDGGVQKCIINHGSGDKQPNMGADVRALFVSVLENGQLIEDCFRTKQERALKIGTGKLVRGLDEAYLSMKQGEISMFKIRSDYGYGDKPVVMPSGELITANTTLFSLIKLIRFERKRTDPRTIEERIEFIEEENADAASMVKAQNYKAALRSYNKVKFLMDHVRCVRDQFTAEQQRFFEDNEFKLNNNFALVNLKLGDYNKCIEYASIVLKTDPNNAKALFRKAQAHRMLAQYDKAQEAIDAALRLLPKDQLILQENQAIKQAMKEAVKESDKLLKNMFKPNAGLYDDLDTAPTNEYAEYERYEQLKAQGRKVLFGSDGTELII